MAECQQSSSRTANCYASAPNDVWSLGVILVNLTCGRNPWKRASQSDSTYRAFLKDRQFLRTILPLSPQLNAILQRVFEPNPLKRISVPELRARIMACPRLTTTGSSSAVPGAIPSPPLSEASDSDYQLVDAFALPGAAYAGQPPTGTLTPPDSAPSSSVSSASSASYAGGGVVLPSPMDFVPHAAVPRSFWQLPLFRREELHGVQVF